MCPFVLHESRTYLYFGRPLLGHRVLETIRPALQKAFWIQQITTIPFYAQTPDNLRFQIHSHWTGIGKMLKPQWMGFQSELSEKPMTAAGNTLWSVAARNPWNAQGHRLRQSATQHRWLPPHTLNACTETRWGSHIRVTHGRGWGRC